MSALDPATDPLVQSAEEHDVAEVKRVTHDIYGSIGDHEPNNHHNDESTQQPPTLSKDDSGNKSKSQMTYVTLLRKNSNFRYFLLSYLINHMVSDMPGQTCEAFFQSNIFLTSFVESSAGGMADILGIDILDSAGHDARRHKPKQCKYPDIDPDSSKNSTECIADTN